jgi:hypothetical protein
MLKYLSIITILILSSVMNLYAQNYALDLDGINDYVSTPIDADLQAMPSTTWSGWIKPTGVSGWQIIFGMEDGGWDRMLTIENGGLGLSMGHTTGRWQTGASVNPGVWQHVVAVYDNGSMKFYLNGVQYTSSTSEGSHSSSGTFTIGANQNGGGNFYKGLIDDVALWNEALTAAEITALYNAGSGLNAAVNSGNYTSSSNLLGYWRMNEGTGSTLTDGSGNSNSGTLVNMDINDWVLNLPLVSKYGSFSNTNYNYVDKNGKEGGMDGIDKRGEIIEVIQRTAGLYKTTYAGYFADVVSFFATATAQTFGANPATSVQTTAISEPGSNDGSNFSCQWLGYFKPTTTETYTFYTSSDDASYAWIGSNAQSGFTTANAIVQNGGTHPTLTKSGTIALSAGVYYPIRIQFGENGGGDVLSFSFSTPTISKTSNVTGLVFYNTATNGF